MPPKKKHQAQRKQITIDLRELSDLQTSILSKTTGDLFQLTGLYSTISSQDKMAFETFLPITRLADYSDNDKMHIYAKLKKLITTNTKVDEDFITCVISSLPFLKTHTNTNGQTLLHIAALHDKQICNTLLRAGFDARTVTKDGHNMAYYASILLLTGKQTHKIKITEQDKLIDVLNLVRKHMYLGVYGKDEDRVVNFERAIPYANTFLHENLEDTWLYKGEVSSYLLNIYPLSHDFASLDVFDFHLLDALYNYTTQQKANDPQKYYGDLYTLYRINGTLYYAALDQNDHVKAKQLLDMLLRQKPPTDAPDNWSADFASIFCKIGTKLLSFDVINSLEFFKIAQSLDNNNLEANMYLAILSADLNLVSVAAVCIHEIKDPVIRALFLTALHTLHTNCPIEYFNSILDKYAFGEIDPKTLNTLAQNVYFAISIKHALVADDNAQVTKVMRLAKEIVDKAELLPILHSFLSYADKMNKKEWVIDFVAQCYTEHPEFKNSASPPFKFMEFLCCIHHNNISPIKAILKALDASANASKYAAMFAKEAHFIYTVHSINQALQEDNFKAAELHTSTLPESSKPKYLSLIESCRQKHEATKTVATRLELKHVEDLQPAPLSSASTAVAVESPIKIPQEAHTVIQEVAVVRGDTEPKLHEIFSVLDLLSPDDENYASMLQSISPQTIHLYFQYKKSNSISAALKNEQEIYTWRYNGVDHSTKDPDIIRVGETSFFAKITCKLEKAFEDACISAIKKGAVSKAHGAYGVKIIPGKCIEIKTSYNQRLYTTEEVKCGDNTLLLFDKCGTHDEIHRIPNQSLHMVECSGVSDNITDYST